MAKTTTITADAVFVGDQITFRDGTVMTVRVINDHRVDGLIGFGDYGVNGRTQVKAVPPGEKVRRLDT